MRKFWLELDIDKCVLCGDCVDICPEHVLIINYDEDPFVMANQIENCNGCKKCIEACKEHLINIIPVSENYTKWKKEWDFIEDQCDYNKKQALIKKITPSFNKFLNNRKELTNEELMKYLGYNSYQEVSDWVFNVLSDEYDVMPKYPGDGYTFEKKIK